MPTAVTMADVAIYMVARGNKNSSGNDGDNDGGNNGGNNAATQHLINSLMFAKNKSIRTSTIILAVFNVLASAATAASIIYDCYYASKRCNPKSKASKFCLSSIHPAETFPLILAIGIVVQGITFAILQSHGLMARNESGCSEIAQFMWPAIMIVPYLQLVFGLECAFRSLGKSPFQARGKYNVTVCCVTIISMLIITWIPSYLYPESNVCFASLVWYISRYGELGLIIFTTVATCLLASAVIIFTRLSRVNMIDQNQRIAASRMVYYLVLGIVSLGFVIPFFVSLTTNNGNGDGDAGMMANVVLNLSGLMSGLLHLFLRSNTVTTSIGLQGGRAWNKDKHQIRIWGPNELAFGTHLVDPVSGPRGLERGTPVRELNDRADSRASLVGREKRRASMESLNSPPLQAPPYSKLASNTNAIEHRVLLSTIPDPAAETSPNARAHAAKQSYSLFPTEVGGVIKVPQQNSSPEEFVYKVTDVGPPPQIFLPGSSRHRRDSSIASSATVQIGLRLSHAPTPSMEDASSVRILRKPYTVLPPSTSNSTFLKPATAIPLSAFNANTLPSPKPEIQSPTTLELQVRSPRKHSPLNPNTTSPTQSTHCYDKLLPPTPEAPIFRASKTQLSPAVYSPEKNTAEASKEAKNPQPISRVEEPDPHVARAATRGKSEWI